MKPPFTSTQEMYNYTANQLMNQNLSQEMVKNNLREHGVTDADAEIVIQNMMVAIEKQRKAKEGTNEVDIKHASPPPLTEGYTKNNYGSFATMQEMYNYAADQLIVKKLNQQTVKNNLMNHGLSSTDADVVIKNMMDQIEKNKPAEVNAKRSEGQKMMLVGLLIGGIGAVLYGTNFKIAGESFVVSYGLIAIGAILFFRGLFKMF